MVDDAPERYLLVKGIAGLGNRLNCTATAILYARLTGRTLVVYWTDPYYSADGSNAFDRYFRCTGSSTADHVPATDSINPSVWRGHLDQTAAEMLRRYAPGVRADLQPEIWRRFSVDLRVLDHPEHVVVLWSFYDLVDELRRHFSGPFAGLRGRSTADILRRILREDLEPCPEITERVDRFRVEQFTGKVVGVHVRDTDKRSRLPAIRARLDRLLAAEPRLLVFLATDNPAVEASFKVRYPSVVATEKWMPTDGRPLHKHPDNPDPQAHGVAALVDMYLLAQCDYLIGDEKSAFEQIASLLSNAPRANVFNLQRGRTIPPRLRRRLWLAAMALERLIRPQ